MNGLMIKGFIFAAVLILATIVVVMQMKIDLSDPINLITTIGAIAIAFITVGVSTKYIGQMKSDKATGSLVGERWDDIGEYSNELPSGWAYSYLGTIIWSMWYMTIGFPVSGYSSLGEYNKEAKAYNTKFEAMHKNADATTLKAMGESTFLVQCAPCHGVTADGLSGKAHDLTKRFSKEQVLAVIANGSNQLKYPMGAMPPMMATGADAEAIATFVAGGMKGTAPASFAACTACHGADGKGNGGTAPNIAEFDDNIITHVLENGKKGSIGSMPSFKNRLTPVQQKAMVAYIQSLRS